ncbi:MAG: Rid family detoxifying hydrolase [bacterium]|nr:Rid family detoxifying hydrolase [bacterium]MDT8396964.1 Rid family detoxifying hydrolase [bacterium]
MKRHVVSTESAPAAIGPYSQAAVYGNLVFCAGQIPLDPGTDQLVEGDIVTQARRVIDNIEAVLAAAGSSLEKVLKLEVFLIDLADFPEVNSYLAGIFTSDPPARVTIGVSALPMGANIEMAATAAI